MSTDLSVLALVSERLVAELGDVSDGLHLSVVSVRVRDVICDVKRYWCTWFPVVSDHRNTCRHKITAINTVNNHNAVND